MSPARFNLSLGLKFGWTQNLYLVQYTTGLEHLFCGNRVNLLGCEQCSAIFLFTYFQWFSCLLLKVTFCAWLLPFNCCQFWYVPLSKFVGSNAGYPGGGGTSAPCSAGIAWAGRGISKAVAWHAPRVWPLWWCLYFWAILSIPVLCWLPWWKWDMRTVFHLHCMGQYWYI